MNARSLAIHVLEAEERGPKLVATDRYSYVCYVYLNTYRAGTFFVLGAQNQSGRAGVVVPLHGRPKRFVACDLRHFRERFLLLLCGSDPYLAYDIRYAYSQCYGKVRIKV